MIPPTEHWGQKEVFVKSEYLKNYIILHGDVESFRCKQRNKNIDGSKTKSFQFVSYKQMKKKQKLTNKKIYGHFDYYTISKL